MTAGGAGGWGARAAAPRVCHHEGVLSEGILFGRVREDSTEMCIFGREVTLNCSRFCLTWGAREVICVDGGTRQSLLPSSSLLAPKAPSASPRAERDGIRSQWALRWTTLATCRASDRRPRTPNLPRLLLSLVPPSSESWAPPKNALQCFFRATSTADHGPQSWSYNQLALFKANPPPRSQRAPAAAAAVRPVTWRAHPTAPYHGGRRAPKGLPRRCSSSHIRPVPRRPQAPSRPEGVPSPKLSQQLKRKKSRRTYGSRSGSPAKAPSSSSLLRSQSRLHQLPSLCSLCHNRGPEACLPWRIPLGSLMLQLPCHPVFSHQA